MRDILRSDTDELRIVLGDVVKPAARARILLNSDTDNISSPVVHVLSLPEYCYQFILEIEVKHTLYSVITIFLLVGQPEMVDPLFHLILPIAMLVTNHRKCDTIQLQ